MLMKTYTRWLEKAAQNQELYEELRSIEGNGPQIEDRFYRELEFGTAGLRGVLGAGTNRMNVFTVGKATQGLSNYLNKTFAAPSVAIGYDSRIHADLFAETAAAVLAANGIKVYLYSVLMPTPAVSFAVRDMGCSAGVMIRSTAPTAARSLPRPPRPSSRALTRRIPLRTWSGRTSGRSWTAAASSISEMIWCSGIWLPLMAFLCCPRVWISRSPLCIHRSTARA